MSSPLSSDAPLRSELTEDLRNAPGSRSAIPAAPRGSGGLRESVARYESGTQQIQASLNRIYDSMNSSVLQSLRAPGDAGDVVITRELLLDLQNQMKDLSNENTAIRQQLKSMIGVCSDAPSELGSSRGSALGLTQRRSRAQGASPVDAFRGKLIQLIREKNDLQRRLDAQVAENRAYRAALAAAVEGKRRCLASASRVFSAQSAKVSALSARVKKLKAKLGAEESGKRAWEANQMLAVGCNELINSILKDDFEDRQDVEELIKSPDNFMKYISRVKLYNENRDFQYNNEISKLKYSLSALKKKKKEERKISPKVENIVNDIFKSIQNVSEQLHEEHEIFLSKMKQQNQ